VTSAGHLLRRWWAASTKGAPSVEQEVWAEQWLVAGEVRLWRRMSDADRSHALTVARRFVQLCPHASRAEMAAALLHDCGKLDSALSTSARVVATVVGPRTAGFRCYHDHEARGAALLASVGSDPLTVALVGRSPQAPGVVRRVLDAADDV
jgi:hypothetical protein